MLGAGFILLAFTCTALVTQLFDKEAAQHYGTISITQMAQKVNQLAAITNLLEFDMTQNPFDGACRKMDLMLPPHARVYMNDMLGPTNNYRAWHYNYLTYYLFPREVATSLDRPAQITRDGFVGHAATSRDDLVSHGFDVEAAAGGSTIKWRPTRDDLQLKFPTSPEWFRSTSGIFIAFCLPLLTTLTGFGLGFLIFPTVWPRINLAEQLACGLALGMMGVAAVTLGLKLCGVHVAETIFILTLLGAVVAISRHGRSTAIASRFKTFPRNPVIIVLFFLILLNFIAAGIFGLVESDAVGAWVLKAKILHLNTGNDLIRWFSEPRLSHAHFDYPTLVPALHAATFDSIGAANEYVTKFWPAWMQLLLIAPLISLGQNKAQRLAIASFFALALVCLPAMRLYAISEGGTMPMIFFVTLGFLQCALAQASADRGRLALGLTLLFGAAMAKFEGFIILAAALLWLVILPWTRRFFYRSNMLWRVLAFWAVAAFPYFWLRYRIPALHYETSWATDALHHPAQVIANAPTFIMVMFAKTFVDPGLATWNVDSGQLHWAGKFEGLSSLYHHSTLGLPWLAVIITVALWFTWKESRKIIAWLLAVITTVLIVFGLVFASFVTTNPIERMLDYYTQEIASSRYLFPLLVSWASVVIILLFGRWRVLEADPRPVAPTSQDSKE